MKNLEIRKDFGTGLESLVDRNSSLPSFGTIGHSSNHFEKPVYSPYTNLKIGTLVKDYSGKESFKSNYGFSGIPVSRKY